METVVGTAKPKLKQARQLLGTAKPKLRQARQLAFSWRLYEYITGQTIYNLHVRLIITKVKRYSGIGWADFKLFRKF